MDRTDAFVPLQSVSFYSRSNYFLKNDGIILEKFISSGERGPFVLFRQDQSQEENPPATEAPREKERRDF